MVSTRKRAAAQEAASDSDDDAPQEVAAHSAREAHQQAAQARAAAAKQVAARKRARAAQRPVAKKLAAEEEEDAADAALDVLPDDVIAAVAGHNGFLVANVGQRVVGSTQQGVLHQTVHIARRARPLERRAGPVNVKVRVCVVCLLVVCFGDY